MKKRLAVLLCLAMIMTMAAVPVFAAEPAATVIIDGQTVSFDVPPVNENGRLLVPLRAIFEKMGATVNWDGATSTASAVKGDKTVVIKIGSLEPTINGQVSKIDVGAKIIDSRTLAPMRFVCEAFGGTVSWDAATKTASVVSGSAPATPATPETPATPATPETPAVPETPATPEAPAAADTPDAVVKAVIAAFDPTTATIDLKGNMDFMGGNDFSAKGTANIAADKKCSSKLDVDLGIGGTNSPSPAFCPFSEIIAGPEADGLALVKTAALSEEGSNYVLTVTGAACPASLLGILDGASIGSKAVVKFTLTTDYTIKIDKASNKVVSVDIKAKGTGNVMGQDPATTISGTVTYK